MLRTFFFFFFQIAEALCYLHVTEQMMHRNISPQSILLTKRGGWKMAGLGFAEKALKDGKVSFFVDFPTLTVYTDNYSFTFS